MDILSKYPEFNAVFERLCKVRRNEILQEMTETDEEYRLLRKTRADMSMVLRAALNEKYKLLEEYTDAVYEQECFELDAVYRQGFLDALNEFSNRRLL